jgi:HSP20 family protein
MRRLKPNSMKGIYSDMSLTQDPFQHLRLFEDAVTRLMSEPRTSRPWSPAVDIFETENELVLQADLPDIKPEEINLQVENQTLTLQGHRRFEQQANKAGYHRIERSYGSFVRTFSVPQTVDAEKVSADYNNGVLTVKLPKKEAAKPRQVKIGVTQNGPAQVNASN